MFKFSSITFFVILFTSFLFISCGKRGEPVPPSLVVPAKIEDFQLDVDPGRQHLAWSIPTVNADNSKPVDLVSFIIRLKKLPVDHDSCLYCDEGFYDYLTVSSIKPSVGFVKRGTFYLPLPEVPFGYVYVFSVFSINSRGWSSEVSNKLAILSLPKVLPPSNLTCHPSASVVDLVWQAPLLPVYFNGEIRYRIYRRDLNDLNQTWKLITPEPVENPEYVDVGLVDWSAYAYVVTAVIAEQGSFYESDFSLLAKVTPGDYTPPDKLENFSAFYFQGSIQLVWDPSPAADLAGYRVYRREPVSGLDQVLAVLPFSTHEFYDTHILFGRTYHYRVTAFDHSDRKNESQSTREVSVTVK